MAIQYASNTDFFPGTGNLNSVIWTPYTTFQTAYLQRNNNTVGTPDTGATSAMYRIGVYRNSSITLTGLTGLYSGIPLVWLRTTPSKFPTGYIGQLFGEYLGTHVQFRALRVTGSGEMLELFNVISTITYNASTTDTYTFICDGSTIKWQYNGSDVTGASATDTTYGDNNGLIRFDDFIGTAGTGIPTYNSNWSYLSASGGSGAMLKIDSDGAGAIQDGGGTGTNPIVLWTGDNFSDNQFSAVHFNPITAPTYVCVRMATGSVSGYYALCETTQIRLYKVTNGTETQLGSTYSWSPGSDNLTVEVRANGTTISVIVQVPYLTAVTAISETDSTYSSGKVGWGMQRGSSANGTLDNWSGGPIGGSGMSAGFGMYTGGTNYALYYNKVTVNGALASLGNFTNIFM